MDLINPWLDADELRQLAESLMRSNPAAPPAAPDAGFSEDFVGFASPVAAPATSRFPLPAAPKASSFEGLDFSQTPTAPIAGQSFDSLLAAMRETHAVSALFLLGANGKVLFGEQADPRLHDIARGWVTDPIRQAPPHGHVHMRFGPGRVLDLIPLSTSKGPAVAGILLASALPDGEIPFWVERLRGLV